MTQYQVKPGIVFDAEYVAEDASGDHYTPAHYVVQSNDGSEPMVVDPELFERFFEETSDADTTTHHGDRLEAFEGKDSQWYWRRRAANGQIVATGGEGFNGRSGAERAAVRENPGVVLRTTLDEA